MKEQSTPKLLFVFLHDLKRTEEEMAIFYYNGNAPIMNDLITRYSELGRFVAQ